MKACLGFTRPLLVPLLLAGCGGDTHATFCFSRTHCNFDVDARGQSCSQIEDCPPPRSGIEVRSAERQVDFEAAFFDGGRGRIDLELQVFGDEVGGGAPVGIRWLGPGISDLRLQGRKDLWRFRGLPISAVDQIEVSIPGTALRTRRDLATPDIEGPAADDPRARLLPTAVLPELEGEIETGGALWIHAPRTGEILASGRAIGVVIEAFPPEAADARAEVIPEDGYAGIMIDRPGRWSLRAILIAEDVCGPPAVELIVIEEGELSAR